ncbi:MAG: hypothetical protein IJY99_01130 [Alphaproteobacteria bacterium]|nr:hypothetical protein [Alphaproteobacteria bacterium]
MGLHIAKPPKKPTGRPTRADAIHAVYQAYLQLQSTMSVLEDVFNRENNYRMRKYHTPSTKSSAPQQMPK